MAKILNTKSIYFNDVNIIPGITKVNSRSNIRRCLDRIIVSPMPSVVGYEFASKALLLNLTVCLHRFCPIEQQVELFKRLYCDRYNNTLFAAVGLDDFDRVEKLQEVGCQNFLLDIANGTIPGVKDFCSELSQFDVSNFMAGNVVTAAGLQSLIGNMIKVKADRFIVRVGQGNGVSCQTSDETGVNRGQITELMECDEWLNDSRFGNVELVSDGGINKAGAICKAFGAGADRVMIGGLFAKTLEAETNISGDGTYFGCASAKAQKLLRGEAWRHTEGKELELKGDLLNLSDVVEQLWGGISSCISYSGYESVEDFIGKATFEIKQNSLPPKQRY